METITSKTNPKIQFIVSLQKEKIRQEHGLFFDEGLKNLKMALEYGIVKEVYLTKYIPLDYKDAKVYLISPAILDKISLNKTPDGVCFIAKIQNFSLKNLNKIVFLDAVQDPGNVGTILRTCLAFDVDALILGKGCASLYNHKTLMASKGANYKLKVMSMDFDDLKANLTDEHKIIGTALDNDSILLSKLPKMDKFVLLLGNEGNGICNLILNQCDYKVKIPIQNIDSLNVGVSNGIVLYHLLNK